MPRVSSPHKKAAFLAAYRQVGNIARAAELSKVSRNSHYEWMEGDPEYPAKFDEATQESIEKLETEARRRAVEGVEEAVWHNGERVGAVRKYSDTLLIFLLKGARPEKYRDNYILPAGAGQVTNNVQINVESLTEGQLREFIDVTGKLLSRPAQDDAAAGRGAPQNGRGGALPPKP